MNQNPYDYDPLTLPYAPKRDKPLSLWNPLDYLLLLYWIFYFPQAVGWYVEKFGSTSDDLNGLKVMREDPIQQQLVLQALLLSIAVPSTIAAILTRLGIYVSLSGLMFGIVGGIIGGIVTGAVGRRLEGLSGKISGDIAFGVVVGVAGCIMGSLAISLAGSLAILAANDLTSGIARASAANLAISLLGSVAFGLTLGIGLGMAAGVASGMAFVVTFSLVLGLVGGGSLYIVLFLASLLTLRTEEILLFSTVRIITGWLISIIQFSIIVNRLDAVFFKLLTTMLSKQKKPFMQSSSPLPSSTLQRKQVSHLRNDWYKGLLATEGLLRYSLQFIPVISAIEQTIVQMPSERLLRSITGWSSMPLYDWDVVRFQSASLKVGLQSRFWENFWVIPPIWRPQVNVELRFDTPPRAACAAFWLLHEERLAEAADAFKVVRELRHGEELYGNARAMAEGVRCGELGEIASWEVPPEPPDELLRPHVREGLLLFGRVVEDTAIVLKSRSARQRNAALNRASGALVRFLKELERYPTPERDNLARIAERWLKIVLSHASQVGTLEVREPVSSPYIVGAIVPPERLVGREDIFALLSAMWSKGGQRDSLVIYGHRRMGKSSIVRNVTHFCQLGQDTGLAVLNLQSVDWSEEVRDLSYAIAFELWQALPTTLAEPEPDDFESRPLPALRRLLAHLHQAHPQRRYILILDEYELLDKYLPQELASSFVTLLRGLTQQHPWLVMALVGLYTLEERSASYYQAIYAWRPIRVGLMDADAVADTLQLETDDFPLEYSLQAVALAHQLSGGQPFLVQLIGDSLVQRFNRRLQQQQLKPPSAVFEASDIHAVVNDPHFYQQGDVYFNGIWKQAAENPSGQHTILQTLAPHKEGHPLSTLQQATSLDDSTFNAALDALMRHDVILCQNDRYRYTVELMRRWVEGGER